MRVTVKTTIAMMAAFFLTACGGGSGGSSSAGNNVPVTVPAKTVQAGYYFLLVRDRNGTVFATGSNDKGQLGHTTPYSIVTVPEKIPGLSDIVLMDAGDYHTLAVDLNGRVHAFGSNEQGALGTGDTREHNGTVVIGGLPKAKDVAAGMQTSYVLAENGEVYAFGDNRYGQLGQGGTDHAAHPVPAKMTLPASTVSVIANGFAALFIDDNGSVYGIGDNGWGKMGTISARGTAVKIPGLEHIVSASLGASHALYLDGSGTVYSMGRFTHGQLGVEITGQHSFEFENTPQKISGVPKIVMVSAGENFSMLLDENGRVWTFGDNSHGQLGQGDRVQRRLPKRIDALRDITVIHAGPGSAFAVDRKGVVYSWGFGGEGILGNGDTTDLLSPKAVDGVRCAVR